MTKYDPAIWEERKRIVAGLHAQGMNDRQISSETGLNKKAVYVVRQELGLSPILRQPRVNDGVLLSTRAQCASDEEAAAKLGMRPSEFRKQMARIDAASRVKAAPTDKFLHAFRKIEFVPPEHSERAERAGTVGRLWKPPAPASWQSPLEAC